MDKLNVLHCKCPGVCTFNFKELLGVALEKMVGDVNLKEVIFGSTVDACSLAVEKQCQ